MSVVQIGKCLKAAGMLKRVDTNRETLKVRVMIDGKRVQVWELDRHHLHAAEAAPPTSAVPAGTPAAYCTANGELLLEPSDQRVVRVACAPFLLTASAAENGVGLAIDDVTEDEVKRIRAGEFLALLEV